MMDEIELQLCLSIDPTPNQQRNPLETDNSHNQNEAQHTTQSQSLIHLCSKKRSVGDLDRQDPAAEYNTRSYYGAASRALTPGDSLRCEDLEGREEHGNENENECAYERGHYLRLPPRKRVRTLSSTVSSTPSEFKNPDQDQDRGQKQNQPQFEPETSNKERDDAAYRRAVRDALKLGLWPESVPDCYPDDEDFWDQVPSGAEKDTTTQQICTNLVAEMDLDDKEDHGAEKNAATNQTHPNEMSMPPPPQPRLMEPDLSAIFRRPQPPFADSCSESAYMPALIDSLSSAPCQGDYARRPHRFSIYEDPDGMDIDGVGFFGQNWCISPDDDKENAEEEGESESQFEYSHNLEHQTVRNSGHQRQPGYNRSYSSGTELFNPPSVTEQPFYHANPRTIPNLPGRIVAGVEMAQPPTAAEGTWASWSTQIPTYFTGTGTSTEPGNANPPALNLARASGSNTSMPTPASTPSRGEYHLSLGPQASNQHEQALPLPSSLSATEVSLRALQSQNQITTSEVHTPDDLEDNPRPRRMRRIIRSVNLS